MEATVQPESTPMTSSSSAGHIHCWRFYLIFLLCFKCANFPQNSKQIQIKNTANTFSLLKWADLSMDTIHKFDHFTTITGLQYFKNCNLTHLIFFYSFYLWGFDDIYANNSLITALCWLYFDY